MIWFTFGELRFQQALPGGFGIPGGLCPRHPSLTPHPSLPVASSSIKGQAGTIAHDKFLNLAFVAI